MFPGIKFTCLLHIFVLLFCSSAYMGILFQSKTFSTQHYQCFRQLNYLKGVVYLIQDPSGHLEESSAQTLMNIKNAGLVTEVGFAGCRTIDPQESATKFVQSISSSVYSKVWIYVNTIFPDFLDDCRWNHYDKYTAEESCKYLRSLLSAFTKNGIKVGVATSRDGWQNLLHGRCDDLSEQFDLFWVKVDDGSDQPTFIDYKPFGGWDKPSSKLLQIVTFDEICGNQVPRIYFQYL